MLTGENDMATTTPQAGSNIAPIQQAFKQEVYELGLAEGAGSLARSDLCTKVTQASKDGHITVDGTADAMADFNRGASERPNAEEGGEFKPGKRAAQDASDLKHYVTLGANVHLDGPELLANARYVLHRMRDTGSAKGLKTWDIMLVWLRAQNASPERALDDSEIETLFLERAKRATDELDRLTSVRNVLNKQIEVYEEEAQLRHDEKALAEARDGRDEDDTDEDDDDDDARAGIQGVYTARDNVDARIATLGGTRKEQRKAARAAERQRKQAEKDAAKAARAAA
jgi:hypothetical protein